VMPASVSQRGRRELPPGPLPLGGGPVR